MTEADDINRALYLRNINIEVVKLACGHSIPILNPPPNYEQWPWFCPAHNCFYVIESTATDA